MSSWLVAENCIADFDSDKKTITVAGKEVSLRPQCRTALHELVKAKKNGVFLKDEVLCKALWPHELVVDADGHAESLVKIIGELKSVLGKDSIKKEREVGYYLTREVKEIFPAEQKLYFESLWKAHVRGSVHNPSEKKNLELIDYFVEPTFLTGQEEAVKAPFKATGFVKHVIGGTGVGKSALLDMLVLCGIFDALSLKDSEVMSENSRKNKKRYAQMASAFFSRDTTEIFPIFIHADQIGNQNIQSVFDLAEFGKTACFKKMFDAAYRQGHVLILADLFDEAQVFDRQHFLAALKKLLARYPKVNVVFNGRSQMRDLLSLNCQTLHLGEWEEEKVKTVIEAVLPREKADSLLEQIQKNRYLRALIKNPNRLMAVMENETFDCLHQLLESMINASMDLRWEAEHYAVTPEQVKLLLGFLACEFLFENRNRLDAYEIRQCFYVASETLKLFGLPYDVPIRDIEYFLKTLSCQTGILKICRENHKEEFAFEQPLLMCWLAGNYMNRVLNEAEEIQVQSGMGGVWKNVAWIDNFIRSVASKEPVLSEDAARSLVMALVMSSENGSPEVQRSILYYLITKSALSLCREETEAVKSGLKDLLDNSFGNNDIANPGSEDRKRIEKLLN